MSGRAAWALLFALGLRAAGSIAAAQDGPIAAAQDGPTDRAQTRNAAQTRAQHAPAQKPAEDTATSSRSKRARTLFQRGMKAYAQGKLGTALKAFERAYAIAPSNELLFNLARVHERMGQAAHGIRHFRTYLARAKPTGRERADLEARIAALEALEARQQAATIKPPPARDALTSEARTFFERGRALYRRGRYAAALESFSAARRFATLPELSYNLARVCEKLARNSDAIDHYRAYLRESRNAPDAEQVRARIRALAAR